MSDTNKRLKVSVSMRTYNHEKFIARAIDSVLVQKVDFDYEIIIGEDCSTDGTRKIIIEYEKRFPNRFRLLLPEKNIGRRNNFIQTIRSCRGQYIALLDGDDYWTSPAKLNKQVDFLESHPECSICFHGVRQVDPEGAESPCAYKGKLKKPILQLEDLLEKCFIQSCSTLFRNGPFDKFPSCFDGLFFSDWPLHIVNAQHGDIGYLDEVLAAFRVYPGGIRWREFSSHFQASIKLLDESIKFYKVLNGYLDHKYNAIIRAKLRKLLLQKYVAQGKWAVISSLPTTYDVYRRLKYSKK